MTKSKILIKESNNTEDDPQVVKDIEDYRSGRKTDGAKRVEEALRRVMEMRKPVYKKGKQEEPEIQYETIASINDRGRVESTKVEVKQRFSMRGLEPHQRYAAERFENDWNTTYAGLRSPGFDPAVDSGGKLTSEHLSRMAAQKRLAELDKYLGDRDYAILQVAIVVGYGPKILHSLGAGQDVVITAEIKRILNKVAGFYSNVKGGSAKDKLWQAVDEILRGIANKLQ